MFKKTAIVAGIAMALSATAQADYRFELDGAIGRTNIDVGRQDADIDQAAIGGTFYLDTVDTDKGPLGEAAFLDHASSISANYVYTDLDEVVEDLEGDQYGVSGRFVLDLDSIPLIFEASFSRETPDFSDVDTYSVGFGAYLTDTTTLVVSYGTVDIDEIDAVDPGDIDAWGVEVKHVMALSGDSALNLEGQYGFVEVDGGDDVDTFNLAATYYINANLGFGTGYARFDNYGVEEDTFSAHAEWFVSEQIGLRLAVAHSEIDDTDIESDSVVLGAVLRF